MIFKELFFCFGKSFSKLAQGSNDLKLLLCKQDIVQLPHLEIPLNVVKTLPQNIWLFLCKESYDLRSLECLGDSCLHCQLHGVDRIDQPQVSGTEPVQGSLELPDLFQSILSHLRVFFLSQVGAVFLKIRQLLKKPVKLGLQPSSQLIGFSLASGHSSVCAVNNVYHLLKSVRSLVEVNQAI